MPLVYLNYPAGTFTKQNRDALAAELTTIALDAEGLPQTPFVASTTWIYTQEYPADYIYHGGKPGGTKVISLEVNAFEGGLDAKAKSSLIRRFTTVIKHRAGIGDDVTVPVYIILRDVAESDWGVFGKTIQLADLKNPASDATPI